MCVGFVLFLLAPTRNDKYSIDVFGDKVNITELITKYLSVKFSIDFFHFYEPVSGQLVISAEK